MAKETTKNKTKQKEEKIDIVEKEPKVENENIEEKVEPKKKLTRQQLRKAIKKDASNITVYVVNLSPNRVKFTHEGSIVFDLKDEGAETDVTLDEFAILKNGHKGYFEKHLLAITDVDCDCESDYEIEDILEFLGVNDVYDEIENYDIDYIKYILLKMDVYDFEKLLNTCDNYLAERIAERAVKMFAKGKLDSIKKKELIAKRIGLKELIY